jgi:hypothetical protein
MTRRRSRAGIWNGTTTSGTRFAWTAPVLALRSYYEAALECVDAAYPLRVARCQSRKSAAVLFRTRRIRAGF